MSKKLASFMAIAAAGLLSLPTLAQERVIEKVAQSGRTTIKSTPVLNAGSMLKANMLIQAIEKGEADKAEFEKIWNKNIPVANHAMRKSAKVDVLPYINDIASERNFYQLSVIDANNDSKTWIYNSYKTCASYTYHEKNNGDDWLITPGIKLEAGRGYDFSVDMAAGLGSYSERFEVKMVRAEDVPTAADLSAGTEVISTKVVSLEEFETYEKEGIWINETGYYYFGIHATTEANRYNLYAKNINVKVSSVTGDILAAPQIEVTPAAKGELKANIKVTAPQKRLDGSDFNTTMSKIEIYRDDILIKTFENVTKGQVLQFTDEKNIIARIHDYYAIPYDSDNKAGMKTDVISVYVGFDIPNLPTEMTATDMADKIGFRWNLVNTDIGIKGGYVDPAEIEYDLYTLAIKELWGYRYLELDENIGSVKNKDYYEYAGLQIDEGEQAFKNFGVRTRNVAGANTDFISCNMLVGKPYELPLIEGMKDKTFHTVWYNDGTVSELSVSKDATDGDGVALDFRMGSGAQPGMAFLSSGKLNLNASAHPALLFDAKRGSENSNLSIYGSKDGGKSEKIADVALKDEYTKFNVDLSSLKGSRYAQIRFVSNFASVNDNVIIDNIMIRDFYTDDLGIAMSAPESVMAGRKAVIEVTVENNGSNTCSNYTVDLYAGEKKIRTETVTEPLKMFEKKQL
ncbi:MAG: hypothetical protein PUH24_04235, partial [Prevotellaceae bacterium]|nr:hypothetical protein [Prevotellaceae bacterium]